MSNLGWYQWFTTTAKKVGGPKVLLGLIAGGGAAVGAGGCVCGQAIVKKRRRKRNERRRIETAAIVYTVRKDGFSNEGLEFRIGDQFKVLARDGNAVLIDRLEDPNSPYYVSLDFLKSISNYECTQKEE